MAAEQLEADAVLRGDGDGGVDVEARDFADGLVGARQARIDEAEQRPAGAFTSEAEPAGGGDDRDGAGVRLAPRPSSRLARCRSERDTSPPGSRRLFVGHGATVTDDPAGALLGVARQLAS